MPVEVRMPSLGMTMEEGKIVAWHVKEGDPVSRGQIMLEIESEKVAYEVEAPADGVVGKILVSADAVVPVGTPLVLILAPGERTAVALPTVAAVAPVARSEAAPRDAVATSGRQRLSPRARKLSEDLGLDVSTLVGSGPGGTVVEKDIREAADRGRHRRPPGGPVAGEAPFVLRPLTSMRRTIADRMSASAREAPHIFLAVEADGSALLRHRRTHGPRLERETGIKLTITDLLLRLTAQTLTEHRGLNASYSSDGIREWDEINLSLAVAVDDGLIAPVIRRADRQSLPALMATRSDLVARARARKLTVDDLQGGTFTLSNLGSFGVDFFTSILNPPQGGILSVGAMRERPVVIDGQVVARPGVVLGLTIDHRVTDGASGAGFLRDLRARVEAPDLGE